MTVNSPLSSSAISGLGRSPPNYSPCVPRRRILFDLAEPRFFIGSCQADVVEAPSAGVFYQPRISGNLYGLADVREQFFVYDKYSSFDFGSMDVEAGLSYIVPQVNNLILRAEYDFNVRREGGKFFC